MPGAAEVKRETAYIPDECCEQDRAERQTAGSGDTEAFSRGGITGVAVRTDDRGADACIAETAETACRIVGCTDAIETGRAIARAEGRVDTDPVLAGPDGAGVRAGAIAVRQAFDRRAALTRPANLTGGAVGIAAAVASYATNAARVIGTADGAVVADVLPAESGIATDIAGIVGGDAITDIATTPLARGDAAIAIGSSAAAAFAFGTAPIIDRPWAEQIDRATQIFAIAMPGAACVIATFGIIDMCGVEMRMTAMIAADFAAIEQGWIGRDIAAAIRGCADARADLALATALIVRIEAAAFGFDQRFETDRNGLPGRGGDRAQLARFLRAQKRSGAIVPGAGSGQRAIGQGAGCGCRRTRTEQPAQKRPPVVTGSHSPGQSVEGELIHTERPNPVGAENVSRHRHAGRNAQPAFLSKS